MSMLTVAGSGVFGVEGDIRAQTSKLTLFLSVFCAPADPRGAGECEYAEASLSEEPQEVLGHRRELSHNAMPAYALWSVRGDLLAQLWPRTVSGCTPLPL